MPGRDDGPTDPSELGKSLFETLDDHPASKVPPPDYSYNGGCGGILHECSPLCVWHKTTHFFKSYFSIFTWIPNYNKRDLPFDIISGLTVGVMMIPKLLPM